MNAATLAAESVVELPAHEVFALFGRAESGSWLFGTRCDSVAVGAPVRILLPVEDRPGRSSVELLGRLSVVHPGRRIVIDHAQPWQGRIRLSFDSLGPRRTRVRARADVPEAGVMWLLRQRGIMLPLPDADTGTLRVGVVTSKSGPAAIYAMATEYLAQLAVDEVNDDGGVRGHRVELVVADDETDPETAAVEAHRLRRAGCHVIFACTASHCFTAIDDAVGRDLLVVHTVMNERGRRAHSSAVQLSENPGGQISAVAARLMAATGTKSWFLVGEQYSWSYVAHTAARIAVPGLGGRILGESHTPVGTTDFSAVIEQIERSGADVVMSSLIGADEVEFERQCATAGLRTRTQAFSLAMDESTREHIGGEAAEGIWTAMAYHQDVVADGNAELLERYRARHGRWAPPLSTLSEAVYEAILQYADAARRFGDGTAPLRGDDLMSHLRKARGDAVGHRNLVTPRLYLAQVSTGGHRVFDQSR